MKAIGTQPPARIVATALTLGALLAGGLPAATAADAATPPATTRSASTAAAKTSPGAVYVKKGSRYYMVFVDASGREQRRLELGRFSPDDIRDAAISPDGTVALAIKVRGGYTQYQSALLVYDRTGNGEQIAAYADSVAFSPDGRRIAYTVTSPDGDGDGYGLIAVRTISVNGGKPTTLHSQKFTVDRRTGEPTQETGGFQAQSWIGNKVVLAWGCCSEMNTSLLPTGRTTRTLTPIDGWPVGQSPRGSVLIRSEIWKADAENTWYLVGLRYSRLTTTGALTKLQDVKDDRGDYDTDDVRVAGAQGFTLYDPPASAIRYTGGGQVLKAF